jgi:ankyrin repeat protein
MIAAASHGYLPLVQLLLQPIYRIPINTSDSVSGYDVIPIILSLVFIGVVFFSSQLGYTALLWACVKGHSAVIDVLVAAGANVNLPNKVWVMVNA